jgi:hypothetical protein
MRRNDKAQQVNCLFSYSELLYSFCSIIKYKYFKQKLQCYTI